MLAMLLLAGCTREDDFQNEKPKGNHSLTAAIEGENGETRTAVDEKGNVTWIETDELGVFGNQNTQNARFRSTGSGANVTFTGNLSTPNEEPEWAYYPYSEQTTVTGQTLTFTLPAQYAYTGNSMAPMLGKRNGANQHLLFKHLCGVMRITINDLPADADRFVITSDGENAPYITGEATVEDIQKEYATLAINGEGGRNVTYQLNTLAAGDGFRSFFLPLPVGEYPKLSIALYAKDATEPYFTRTVSNLNVQRAKMIDMPVLDGTTGAQYVLNENTKEITEELAKKISTSESGNNTLTYAHAQKDEIPVVGNVVWSRVQEGFPQGFLGKVTEVISNNDGTHTIKTEAAALSEAFDVLYVNEVANLKPEEGKSTRATKNNNPYILFGIELTNHIEMESEYPDASLYMYAGADFGSQFKTYIELDNKNHIEFAQFTFINSFTTEGHISMNGQIGSEDDITLPLKEIKFKNIPMAYGLVQITPTITPYLAGRAVGNMENKVGFKTKIQHISGALFKNGTWKAGGNPNQRGENASPWKLESNMNFSGECYAGFGFGLNAKFYGRDDMRLSVVPEAGVKLSGEIDINQDNIQSLEQILSDSKLASSIGIQAKLEADASVISPTELQAELELFELELWKREVSLLPIFKKLFGTAKPKEDTSQTPESYEAEVKTEAGGATLMENTEVSFALENQETGEIEEITEPIAYNGDVEGEITENETPQDASIPMDVKFENLKKDVAYKVYPIVVSPIIQTYVEEKRAELKSKAIILGRKKPFLPHSTRLQEETTGSGRTTGVQTNL